MKAFFLKGWVGSLVALLGMQLIYIFFETVWSPNFRDFEGTLLGRISESVLFTEWFALYDTPLFNLFSAFFAIILLPHAIFGAMKDLVFKKRPTSRPS